MSSELKLIALLLLLTSVSCTPYRKMQKIRSGELAMELSVADELPAEDDPDPVIDSIRGSTPDDPLIMNAIRDDETGEMVATDIIDASRVVARFRNVAERAGYVSLGFDVIVPEGMADSRWQIRINPFITLKDERRPLDPVYVTGQKYRALQLKGYERYRRFLSTIITDTLEFINVGQLEIFLRRNFPETYAMKTDSSIVSEPMAENLFGVSQIEALRHFTDKLRQRRNEGRIARSDRMYGKYVKDPIKKEGVRLDTVMHSDDGEFIYRYTHTFRSQPGLKKAVISLEGGLFEDGNHVAALVFPEDITFYISSLSTLMDDRPKYRMMILRRRVFDNTKALIDFSAGSSAIDTTVGDNSSELARVIRCIEDVCSRKEYALDSLVIVASCSPEGSYETNKRLSRQRAEAVREYISDYLPESWRDSIRVSEMPENWEQLIKLVQNDSLLGDGIRSRLLACAIDAATDPDGAERMISRLPQYRYLREKIYPKLRSVRFDFHLHRVGMQKDTVHTSELDTIYMSGLQAMRELDYRRAVEILRPYADLNSALAFMAADYNYSALDVLQRLDDGQAKVCYLKSVIYSRLGQFDEALKYYSKCVEYDPGMQFRANLDPEMFRVVNKYKSFKLNRNEI